MIALPSYHCLSKIYDGSASVIYRGIRSKDQQPVIIKVLKADRPSPDELARYRQEYEIVTRLNLPRTIEAYSLEKYRNTLAIIFEDFGAESLKILMSNYRFSEIEFLNLAIEITKGLSELHEANIIHKDINPTNIVFNPETGRLKIIDFGISTILSQANPASRSPSVLEGTLDYISPEQTGRTNQPIDYRTDFYALGATFYELLVQRPPFDVLEPVELIHCHIAKYPIPPYKLDPKIPKAISNLVMKLLAKTADERYQSALGIQADLEKSLTYLQANQKIPEFNLADRDSSGKLKISQKLYGREKEIQILLNVVRGIQENKEKLNIKNDKQMEGKIGENNSNIVTKMNPEIFLISGYSGVGKSILVQEVCQGSIQNKGYFITGKFDQNQQNIPYFGIVKAFQELVSQLLGEGEKKLQAWKMKLLEALGSNAQIIIAVIPEVELILGSQPAVPKLDSKEAKNRFNLVFQNFIQVFIQPEHPLIVFLDDLQWADSASLKLVRQLMAASESKHFLLLGAYRDNEVGSNHRLILFLEDLQQDGVIANGICLAPLEFPHIKQLLKDTFRCSKLKADLLAKLVLRKTNGNPFFINEFLKSLYAENLLYFDFDKGQWQWDLESIKLQKVTDNVVDLIAVKIQQLPVNAQAIIRLAACIGNRFELNILRTICEQEFEEILLSLQQAISASLILLVNDSSKALDSDILKIDTEPIVEYKFVHDRIQQAAYSLIHDDRKKSIHWQIGQRLLNSIPAIHQQKKIFDIVNQLNLGIECIDCQVERDQLAELNLVAGQKAKASTAYESAVDYFEFGIELLESDCWERQYALTLSLHKAAIETAYLAGDFGKSETFSNLALNQAKTLLEKVSLNEIKIQFYMARNQMEAAIDLGLAVLKELQILLSESPPNNPFVNEILDLPLMFNPKKLAAMKILSKLFSPAFLVNPALLQKIAFTMIDLCSENGNSALSAFAYGFYGMFLCGELKNVELGYQFGKLSLKLLEKFEVKEISCKVNHLFDAHIRFWKEPLRNSITPLKNTIKLGLDTGDIEYSCYASLAYCNTIFLVGKPLEWVLHQQRKYIDLIQKLKQEHPINYARIWGQLTLNLGSQVKDKKYLVGELFNEIEMLPILLAAKDLNSCFSIYLAKTILNYLFKDYREADANSRSAQNYAKAVFSLPTIPLQNFYQSLVLLAQYRNINGCEQVDCLKTVDRNQSEMRIWADCAPENFLHKYDLVAAEKARVLDCIVEAMDLYERAIQGAKKSGYLQDEALAYELAAEFYLERRMDEFARLYISKAHYGYIRWQAWAKIEDLESRYPQFFTQASSHPINNTATFLTSSSDSSSTLDLASILKASQALSGEMVLEHLLTKLMRIVIENAGAEKGYLILRSEAEPETDKRQWAIEASGTVEPEKIVVLQSIPLTGMEQHGDVPLLAKTVVNYVIRTQKHLVVDDAVREGNFIRDPYIIKQQPKSILCMPLLNQNKLLGILYLENNLVAGAFTSERLEVLNLLSSQAAISIENAQLYAAASESHNRLTQFLEAMPVAVGVLDRYGNPCYTNQRAIELLGRGVVPDASAEEISDVYQLYVAGTDRVYPAENLPIVRALRGEKHTVDDVEIYQEDKIVPVEGWGTPIYDQQGNVVYGLVAFQDITSRKQMEQVLADYNRTLEAQVAERTEALRESEERFRNAFETAAVGMCLVDFDGHFLAVNVSACEIWGYSESALLSMTVQDITHPADLELSQRALRKLIVGEVPHYQLEKRYLHKNGETIWGLLSVSLIRDTQKTPLYLIAQIQDITARKILERELAVREARLNAFFGAAPVGMTILDEQLRYVQINEPLAHINGSSVEDHIGKSLYDVIPEIAPQIERLYQQVLDTGQPIINCEVSGEVPSQPGAQRHWVVSHFPIPGSDEHPGALGTVVVEITERKQAEAALRESEEKYRALQEGASDAILIADVEGHLLEANQRAEELLGYSRQQLAKMHFTQIHPPQELPRIMARFEADIRQQSAGGTVQDTLVLTRSGETVPVDISGSVTECGGKRLVQAIFRDITGRKRAELALRESEERFRAIFEQAAVGIFTATPSGQFLRVNRQFCDLLDYTELELLERTSQEITPPEDLEFCLKCWNQLLEGQAEVQSWEKRYLRKGGQPTWVNLTVSVVCDGASVPQYLIAAVKDIEERKRREEALRLIVEGTAATTGGEFFRSCVRSLAEVLQVHYALVTEFANAARTRMRTLAFWAGADWDENFEYELVDTPCENVLDGQMCFYRDSVQARFPNDGDLVEWGAQSYLGMPLLDSAGVPLGHLAVLDVKPMKTDLGQESILRIFAARAGAELERQQADAALVEQMHLEALGGMVGVALTRGDTLREMLGYCAIALQQHLNSAFARIWTLNEMKDVLELQASAGMYTHLNGKHSRIPVGHLKIGWIAQNRQPHLTNDLLNDPGISDRAWAQREGMVAFAGYPLMLEDQFLGVMAIFARQPLAQTTLEAMGSVANEIALGIDRKLAEQALQHQADKDSLLGRISRAFIDRDLDVAISFALQEIGQFVGCDRSGVLSYDETRHTFITTYKWSKDPIDDSEYSASFPATAFPWFYQHLLDNNPVVISQLEDLPVSAIATREALTSRSIQSLLAVPTIHLGKVVGFVDLSTTRAARRWTQEDIRLLEFAGELIAIAQSRRAAEDALRASEQRYRSIYDNTPVMLHSIDRSGRLVSVSNYWLQKLGYQRHEVIGRHSTDFLTEASRRYAKEVILPQYFQTGICRDIPYQFVKRNGEVIDVLLSATAQHDRAGQLVRSLAIIVDVTERKRVQALLTGQNLILEMIAYGAPLKSILDVLARLVEGQSQQMLCSFLLVDKDNKLCFGAAPSLPDVYNQAIQQQGVPIGPQQGTCGTAAYRQETVIVTDIATDPLWEHCRQFALPFDLRACWSTPILSAEGKILGTFAGYYRTPQPPPEEDQSLVAQTIYLAKIAIERQRSQETLQETSTRLTLAIEANRDGLFDLNLKTHEDYYSPQWRNLIGYPLDEPGPSLDQFLTLIHPEEVALVRAMLDELFSGQRSQWQIEFRMLHRDGSTPWILSRGQIFWDRTGTPVRMSGTHTDISDRKRAEAEIRELSIAMQNAVEGLARLDPQGCYTFVNRAYAHQCGYEPEEMLGMDWSPTVHPEDMPHMQAAYASMRALGKVEAEARGLRKDGSLFYKQVTMVSAYDKRGEFSGHYCFLKDISDRKRAEAELQQAKEAAEIANQAKSEFLANMSHEIRTPMNGVLGMADLLVKTPLNPEQQDLMETLKDSASNLMAIVNDILDLSKLEAGKVQIETLDFDLSTCLREVAGLLSAQASAKGLKLLVSVDENVPTILKGDPVRLRQILMNLTSNAIKFTDTGAVSIAVSCEATNSQDFSLSPSQSQLPIRFEVQDTGIGIAPADQEKVFHKFSQVDASTTRIYGGTGLGLSICQQLVQLMGGNIGVTSQLGQGSTFWFVVPFEQRTRSERSPEPSTEEITSRDRATSNQTETGPEQLSNIKILLVEDNRVNQKVALRQLQRLGCRQADCANNGQEALAKLAEQDYDIVLMDCQMPVLDGYQATQILRQREQDSSRHTIVISLTAGAMKGDREKCLAAGMDDYITKPVVLAELEKTLHRWAASANPQVNP